MQQHVKSGTTKAYNPPGAFEGTVRKIAGEWWLFIRYVGEGAE
jgi:hypothetical protein